MLRMLDMHYYLYVTVIVESRVLCQIKIVGWILRRGDVN